MDNNIIEDITPELLATLDARERELYDDMLALIAEPHNKQFPILRGYDDTV